MKKSYTTDRGFESHANIEWPKYLKTVKPSNILEKDLKRIESKNKPIAVKDIELIIILPTNDTRLTKPFWNT